MIRPKEENQESHAENEAFNQLGVEEDEAAHFDGFEDSRSSAVPDLVEEDDAVDEKKTIQKTIHSTRDSKAVSPNRRYESGGE